MSLALLSLGVNFMGGLYGKRSADKNRRMQREQLAQAQRQFDAQMDQSVQRRVKDAKNAGVHPLFALGASVGASPTISADATPQGSPMQSALTNMAKHLGVIEQNRASARRDEAEAALLDSERARIEQDLKTKGSDSTKTPEGPEFPPAPTGFRNATSDEGGQGGRFPDRIPVTDTAGNEYDLPNPDLGLDEVGQIEYVLGVPDRVVKTMKKNASTKYEIMKLEQELAWLQDKRRHGGKDWNTRQSQKAYKKAQAIYKRYAALRRKAQNWWKVYKSKPGPVRRNLDKHPIYKGVGR